MLEFVWSCMQQMTGFMFDNLVSELNMILIQIQTRIAYVWFHSNWWLDKSKPVVFFLLFNYYHFYYKRNRNKYAHSRWPTIYDRIHTFAALLYSHLNGRDNRIFSPEAVWNDTQCCVAAYWSVYPDYYTRIWLLESVKTIGAVYIACWTRTKTRQFLQTTYITR